MRLALLAVAVFFAFTAPKPLIAADAPRPNILYVYVDDMGWGSIGPNGQAERKAKGLPYVRTPFINKLAANGVNFKRGYACTVCSPSRASQQSGFHQGHTFSDRNDPNNAKKAMRADDVLMGDVLSAAGYETGYWGKWGYGGSKDQQNPVIENVQTLPTTHGYRHVLAELHHVRAHTFFQPTLWHAPAQAGSTGGLELIPNSMAAYQNNTTQYPNTPAFQNHADYPKTGYCDDAYAFAALDFVRTHGTNYNKTGKPFFGLFAAQIPHAPFDEISKLPKWDQAYADDPHFESLANQSKQWAAMVTRLDSHFGNLLAALEDPNNDGQTDDSIVDNTLVIFQSDNGGPGGKSNVELDANGGLSGNKGSIQEGGIRVPLVMRWPKQLNSNSTLKAGSNTEMVVDITDLLPTFCDLAGTKTPLGLDGVSIAPTLLSQSGQRHRDFLIHEAGQNSSIIQGKHKLIRSKSKFKLFDLESDPAESHNIAAQYADLVKQLKTLLLDERVTEPRGFANTYHHWTGKDSAKTSDADNWSDYVYSNAGVTYTTDDGPPQSSWTAQFRNSGEKENSAVADKDLNFLALEISGAQSTQRLELVRNITLTGRNEVRVGSNGILSVRGSRVSSQRWIEIETGGVVNGSGIIDCDVYNHGSIFVAASQFLINHDDGFGIKINTPPESETSDSDIGIDAEFKINADYHQSASGTLGTIIDGDKTPTAIHVAGNASLAGQLKISTGANFGPRPGQDFVILKAAKVTGKFSNPDDQIVTRDGTRFRIQYSKTDVTLKVTP